MSPDFYLGVATIAILVTGSIIVTWAYKELAKGVKHL